MRSLLLLAAWLSLALAASAQNGAVDSLNRVIATTKSDTVKGRTLCRLCDHLLRVGQIPVARQRGEEGLDISLRAKDDKGIGDCLNYIGVSYYYQADYPKALDYLLRSLAIRERINDRNGMASCLGNIGNIYMRQGNNLKALGYLERATKVFEELGNLRSLAICLNSQAVTYNQLNQNDIALEKLHKALEINERRKSPRDMAYNWANMGNAYLGLKDFSSALSYYQQAVQFHENAGDVQQYGSEYINIGNVYEALKQHEKALEYGRRGFKLVQDARQLEWMQRGAFLIYRTENALGNYKEALEAHVKYKHYSDSLRNDQRSKELGRLEALYESEKEIAQRDLSITRLEADRLRKDLALKEERSRHLQESLANAERNARLQADAQRLSVEVRESRLRRQQDSLLNASRFDRLERDRVRREAAIDRQRWLLGSTIGGLLLLALVAFTLFRSRRKEKHANAALRVLNEEIAHSKSEIEAMNAELQATLDEVNEQRQKLEEQHEKIEDSIRYASRIQHAILPSETQLDALLPARFIHYQPRDIVSGDFYWAARFEDKTIFAAVDCTGHGVPGAFMSVVGFNLLNQIVNETGITRPAAILKALDRRIVQMLHQRLGYSERESSKDGMDVALIVLHEADASGNRVVEYAGAGRPFWHWRDGQFTEYKSAKYACGGSQHEAKEYPAQRIEARPGDRLYLFSDGVTDQFGGPQGRKLGAARLQAFLAETAALPIAEQGLRFREFFSSWMEGKKQLDDVLLAGVAV